MRTSGRMWAGILIGIIGAVLGAGGPAWAAPEPLRIATVDAIGREAPAVQALAGPGEFSFPLPAAGRSLNLVGRLNASNAVWRLNVGRAVALMLESNGKLPDSNELWKLGGRQMQEKSPEALALIAKPETLMTIGLTMPGKVARRMPYFLKPSLNFYTMPERTAVAARYPEFPSALTHAFTVRIENSGTGIDLWLDGRYLGRMAPSTNAAAGSVTLARGNELLNAFETPALRADNYLPLDLAPYARPGTYRFLSEVAGLRASAMNAVATVPMLCLDPKGDIDVGLSRWLEEKEGGGYCDNDTTRNAFIGCPEAIILQVPKENYLAAHVLCALEPSTNKIPVLTLRVTRFGRHYGDSGGRCDEAFADTTVVLPADPAEPLPANVKKVATIKAAGSAGADGELPVYLVTVPLKLGGIPDLLGDEAPDFDRGNQYWEIELTKAIRLKGTRRKPVGTPSAVHVFGMTLERNPVNVQVSSLEPGNIFCAADNPRLDVRLANTRDTKADLTLKWEITDYYGRKTVKSAKVVAPAKGENGGVAVESISLAQPTLGYFDAVITVTDDASGRELWHQATSFVLLPPDTRKAGPESPFGTWWFAGTHGTCDKLEIMGPIMMKLGMRHVCPRGVSQEGETNLAPYKLTYSMVPWLKTDEDVAAFVQRNPNIRLGMIFHESGISDSEKDYPYPELLGKPKPELTAKGKEEFEKLWAAGEKRARLFRTNYPSIKISLGNTHSPLIVQLLRHGFPKQYIDCIGMEGVSGWTTPEGQPEPSYTQEVWWVREIERIYGYGDIPVSSGYEYITRGTQRGSGLTEREQADYYVRDALQCLAYGYWSINIGSSDDFADSYNATIYGGGGFVRRHPLLTPKPVFATWATMTRVLDSAAYVRYLDTGSRGLYALEFKRDNTYVYPLWTVRGKRQMTVTFEGGKKTTLSDIVKGWFTRKGMGERQPDVLLTDPMGNTVPLASRGGRVTLQAGPSPAYLVSTKPVARIEPGAAAHEAPALSRPVVISDFSDPSAWVMDTNKAALGVGVSPAVIGKFTLAAAEDPEKGNVTELTLEPQPDVPKIASRCISLKPVAPVRVTGDVKRLGLWVKGNSCWGRVFFEFVDAKGERYKTRAGYWDRNKLAHTSAINYDGWQFISQDLPQSTPQGKGDWLTLRQAVPDWNWSSAEGDKDGVVQFPITITRVDVAMRDWQVYVTNMVPSQSRSIRLGRLMAGD